MSELPMQEDRVVEAGVFFRRAIASDLPAIVSLLFNDPLGRQREDSRDPPNPRYVAAFDAIQADPNQYLAVACRAEGEVVGCLQVSFLPGLSRLGQWRGQIEGVRVAESVRGTGIGARFFQWAIDLCRSRGCGLVQLTTDKARPDAHRFYEGLGFVASHEGMKLSLEA